jgi:hypothetical protein
VVTLVFAARNAVRDSDGGGKSVEVVGGFLRIPRGRRAGKDGRRFDTQILARGETTQKALESLPLPGDNLVGYDEEAGWC